MKIITNEINGEEYKMAKENSLSNLKQFSTDSQNSEPRGKVSEQIAKQ